MIAHVVPEALLADITDLEDVARFGDAVDARTMGDIMLPPAVIAATATVDEAFRLMHRRRLSGLYVLDSAGRPSGYLDLLELGADGLAIGPLWWALALGACLGGNATIIGASANVVVANLSARAGHPISFGLFLRYGAVVTRMSMVISSGYHWVRYLA